jgi:molybdate transport system substrate-binding protein
VRRIGLVLVALLAACGGGRSTTTITVLAASSLTDAFAGEATAFTRAHPDVRVRFSFAASSALVQQANAGAPGDVLATADRATFDRVDGVGRATVVARNRLAILVAKGNPEHVRSLADLARVTFVLCAPQVPCGKLARSALDAADVAAAPRSLEESAKGVVSKVALGAVDAGLAYATDASDDVDAIAFAGAPTTAYPMGVLAQSDHAEAARSFVAFVASPAGRAILQAHGFLAP